MIVVLKAPYKLGNKLIATGSQMNVTPELAKVLIKGGYIDAEMEIENAMYKPKSENAKIKFRSQTKN